MDTEKLDELVTRVGKISPRGYRTLIAIAGPPASGKSRLAAALVKHLNRVGNSAVMVPMDGFHLDNRLLEMRGLLPRKGAPETFDGVGFVHAVARLSKDEEVILPTFDRKRDMSIAGAIAVGPEHRIAVIEGNYLCFNEPPWVELQPMWDLSCYLDVDPDVLRERLLRRWLDHGYSPAEAMAKARENDLPNASRINAHRSTVGQILRSGVDIGP